MEKIIKILTKKGDLEDLDLSKISKKTAAATEGIPSISKEELELKSKIIFYDGMKTSEIDEALIKTANSMVDVDTPEATFVAARLLLFSLQHQVGETLDSVKGNPYGSIKDYLVYGEKIGKIIPGLKDKYDLEEIDRAITPERDNQFTYLGLKMFTDRYLLKNKLGEIFELPQHLFMGVSMFLAQKEDRLLEGDFIPSGVNLIDHKKYIRTYWAKKFYKTISTFEVMLATPTLSNARTPRSQLSSCYVNSTPDLIEGIFDVYKEHALLSKFGGGIGCSWSEVRGMDAFIDGNKDAAGGLVPFLKIQNDVAVAVDQLGTRKGAIAAYIEPWHIDVEMFLDLKKTSGEERRRAHDIFPAMWLNDIFMERVAADEDWTLFSPDTVPGLTRTFDKEFNDLYVKYEQDETIPKVTIKAKKLWKIILREYFETGSPYLGFKDTANRANQNKHSGIIMSSNLCTEIFMNTSPNEYLINIEFTDGSFQSFDENQQVTTDEGVEKLAKKIVTMDEFNGKMVFFIGKKVEEGDTAVCNLASVNLSKINKKADIERVVPIAVRMLDNVIDLNFYPTRKARATNAKTRGIGLGTMGEAELLAVSKIMYGSKEHFNKINQVMEMISYNVILASHEIALIKGSYTEFEGSEWSKGVLPMDYATDEVNNLTDNELMYDTWDELREKVKKAMRNGYLMAVAPTSSISLITGTTQANEPVFKRFWREENMSGIIPTCAPKLSPDTWNFYVTAYDLDQMLLVMAAAIRQKWLDQGQSLNIFIGPDKMSMKYLNDIYMMAWKLGLKSTYYLRTTGAETADDGSHVEDRSQECVGCQ